MASNSEIATVLRVLAQDADTEIATHDLNTLADALDGADSAVYTGIETAEDAVAYIRKREGEGAAHVSHDKGHEGQPYIAVVDDENIPPGWEREDRDDVHNGHVLVKA